MRWLKTIPNSWWLKVHGSPMQMAGVPDIIGCLDGHFVGIELKVGSNQTSKIQKFMIAKIKTAGGSTVVAYSLKEVRTFIERIQNA